DEQPTVYHAPEYLARVAAISASGGGDTGAGAPIGLGGEKVARLATGGTIAAVDAVMTNQVDTAYALVRPPGHHAMAGEGMGYCVFNNAVVAARQAQRRHGAAKMLILDWDVHHGNGTQAAFWSDPRGRRTPSSRLAGAPSTRSESATAKASRSTSHCLEGLATAATRRRSLASSCRSRGSSRPISCSSPPARTQASTTLWRGWRLRS